MMSVNGRYALGIVLAFGFLAMVMLYSVPVINLFFNDKTLTADLFFYNRLALWMVLGLIFIYNFFIENRSFFLWEDKKYSAGFYIASIVALYIISTAGGALLNALIMTLTQEKISGKLVQLQSIFKHNYFLIIFTCFTAGVVEELLMRAYIQPRIEKIYNSPVLGIVISSLLFAILHMTYGTIGQVAVPFFIGIVFAAFYKKYSNIKILIICHFIYDFVSLMLMNFIDLKHVSFF
ncbi:CPBP family intramembrane metalloprotease [Chryseobacterium sp. GMJ5]|uniref:CPBP family intramembrane metalloprotease n=1 Tax=Chryseobacterium gilvum TaxID=2976534 RepID=A0ABT2VW74_9FLAO|nr:type II CAAX endopeptidase family protein [Chryseobacterium gilvum]MCU7613874.1 CPBP family intramembrane metalloprotease [Chryseobacterium gilvum]